MAPKKKPPADDAKKSPAKKKPAAEPSLSSLRRARARRGR